MGFKNIPQAIRTFAATRADKSAFVFVSTDKTRVVITWSELYDKSKEVANALVDIGVQPGEIVAISVRGCPEWLYLMFGAMMMGAIPGNLAFTYSDGRDVVAMVEKMRNCALIVMDPGTNEENWKIINKLVSEIRPDGSVVSGTLPYVRHIIFHDPEEKLDSVKKLNGWISEERKSAALPEIHSDDVAYLFQTSGSTGAPKIVVHTYKSIIFETDFEGYSDGQGSVIFNNRPFAWAGGFPYNVLSGDTRVMVSGFGPEPTDRSKFVVDIIRQEKCSSVFVFPSDVFDWLANHEALSHGEIICDIFATGGQPTTASVAACVGKLCRKLLLGYGSTEFFVGSSGSVTDPESYADFMSGKIFPGVEVKIVDDDEEIVPDGVQGEIYIRSSHMFKGYLNDEEKTKAVLSTDGWYRTGDKGRLIDGNLYAEGRKSFEIIRAGMNIAPEILEEALKTCSWIQDTAVVPVPHPHLYQEICACVILAPDVDVCEDDIKKYLLEYHGDSKRQFSYLPAVYMFMKTFPTTSTGKISRIELAKLAKEHFQF